MADQIIDDYMSSLADLTFNSKPHINMLTMIAEENIKYAEAIVRVIEQHLQQAQPVHMLPVMYLIDSIIKNVQPGSYQELFAKNLVKTFCGVFEKVDEKTRQAMFKLRQTWPTIFSNSKLYSLDTGVQQLDPAWPMTATTPDAKPKDIHVNPKFLKKQQDEEMARRKKKAEEAAAKQAAEEEEKRKQEMAAHTLMQQQLFEKQQELLRLQQQKLEMEVMEAKVRLDQQKHELEVKEKQLQIEAEMKLKAQREEAEKAAKIKQEKERQAALRREQEKAEALKKQLEARAFLIKQKAAANKKEADIKASYASQTALKLETASKDPRLNRDPRLQSGKEKEKPGHPVPSPAQGAKVVTPATRLDDDDEVESSQEVDRKSPDESSQGMGNDSTSKEKFSSRSTRGSNSKKDPGKRGQAKDSRSSLDKSADGKKTSFSRKSRAARSYRGKRESESPEDNKDTAELKRSRSKSPQTDSGKIKPMHKDIDERDRGGGKDRDRRRGRDRRSDQKRGSTKDKDGEEPPAKMTKSEDGNKENKKLPEDLAALFGTEDQDYRSLPPIPKLNTAAAAAAAASSSDLVSPSPNSSGWAQFKASRPEEFPFSQPRLSMDVDMRSPPLLLSPPFGQNPIFGSGLLSPEQENIVIPKPMLLDSAEGILKEAQMQLKAGKLSHEQHQELLKQLDQLFKLQSLKQQLRHNAVEENTHKFMAAQKAFDEHTMKIRETIVNMGERSGREPRRGDDMAAHSPLYDDSRENRRGRQGSPNRRGGYGNRTERNRGPQREFPRRNSIFSKLGPQRDVEIDKPIWQMPPGELSLPYDMMENYVPSHDPRWYIPSDGPEVTHEVVIDGRGWELPYCNKPRPIRLGSDTITVKANPYTREVTINDQVYYRVGEPIRSIMLQGISHSIAYRGPLKKVWIASFMFEVPSDAPPTKIMINDNEHDLRFDSVDNTVIIDGHVVCGYGDNIDFILVAGNRYEIRFVPPARQILIDGNLCELDFSSKYPCIFKKGKPHGIRFDGPPRNLIINGKPWTVHVDRPRKARLDSRRVHILGLGGPGHEVIIDGKWYEVKFGGPEKNIQLGNRIISIKLAGPPPEVKILGELVDDPLLIDKLSNGYRIDPSSAIDTNVKFLPNPMNNNGNNFNQQGKWFQQRGPGNRQDRFGLRQHGFNNQHGMWQDKRGFKDFKNQGRFRRDGPRGGPRMSNPHFDNNMGFKNEPPFPGPDNNAFVPQGQMPPFDPMMGPFPPMNNNMGPNAFQGGPPPDMPQFQGPPMQNDFNDGMRQLPPMNIQPMPNQVNVNDLFSKLLQFGIINKEEPGQGSPQKMEDALPPAAPPQLPEQPPAPSANSVLQLINLVRKEPAKNEEVFDPVPDLTDLAPEKLKMEYPGSVQKLYSGIQCSSCGVRFIAEDTSKYREHLDWHFRQNKKDKDEIKVTKFRRWYYTMLEWIQFEEISEYDESAQSAYFERIAQSHNLNTEQGGTSTPPAREEETITSCPVAGDEADDVCDICGDPFEQFWSEESEAWHLKDAIRADGKTYHPVCYEDFRETSMMETPTPDQERSNPLRDVVDETSRDSLGRENGAEEVKGAPEAIIQENPASESQTDDAKAMLQPASESSDAVPEKNASPVPEKAASPLPEKAVSPVPEKIESPLPDVPCKVENTAEITPDSIGESSNDVAMDIAENESVETPHSPVPEQSSDDKQEEIQLLTKVHGDEEEVSTVSQPPVEEVPENPASPDEAENATEEDDPDIMLNIEPLASPKTPLQDEPPTPPGSPLARQVHSASPIITRLSLLNKEALTMDPMAIVQQHLSPADHTEGSSSARESPVTTRDSPVAVAVSAPSSTKTSPVAQMKGEEPSPEKDLGQPISSVLGVFRRSFRR